MANRTVTVFKSSRKDAFFGTGSIRNFNWTYVPGSGAEDQNVTGVTYDGKYLIFCTDEPNPALGTSARFVVVDPRTGSVVRNFDCGIISDGGLRDICWDGKYIWGIDYYANDAVPTCAISKYSRKTGGLIRTIASGLATDRWSIAFDGKNILVLRITSPSPTGVVDVYNIKTGAIVATKTLINVLDFGLNIHPGIEWDGKYILDKCCPQSFFAVPMQYKAHHRRQPDGGAGVLQECNTNSTTNPRAGETYSLAWDGKYLYDFAQV